MKKITMLIAVIMMAVVTGIAMKPGEAEKEAVRTVSLSGQVLDIVSGEGLAGVKVQLEETDEVIYTDFDGNFSIEGLLPGSYNITASYISYKSSDVKVDVDDTRSVQLTMEQIVK